MSEFLQALSQMWATITTNIANTNLETWLILLSMFVTWGIFVFFSVRDYLKNPEKYKDSDKFIPPY